MFSPFTVRWRISDEQEAASLRIRDISCPRAKTHNRYTKEAPTLSRKRHNPCTSFSVYGVNDKSLLSRFHQTIRQSARQMRVVVTHNMHQAARTSDFTAFMYLGELVEFGDTTSIFEKPKSELTEKYLTGKFG